MDTTATKLFFKDQVWLLVDQWPDMVYPPPQGGIM